MVEARNDSSQQREVTINKSEGDQNEYFYYTLPNKVKVLLVQDNNQKELTDCDAMAYASFVMNVGSFNDPPHRYGLAHFTEHMLFMGSEKYEEESAFSDHCSANGGYSNAYTSFEWTNY
jgi:insulysin